MKLINCAPEEFMHAIGNNRIVCFGAGVTGIEIVNSFSKYGIMDKILCFIDNDNKKWGEKITIADKEFEVLSPIKIISNFPENTIIFITSRFWHEIYYQLEEYSQLIDIDCYTYILFKSISNNAKVKIPEGEELIPRRIYYCWFGTNEMSDNEKKCIDSWYKYCPNYEITCINEDNYDVSKSRYLREVYEYGHYSAVSNYARFETILLNGGIYFDTDVEVVRNIDELLRLPAFMGFEIVNIINSGHGFGTSKGNLILREFLDYYDSISHYDSQGVFKYTPCPIITTNILKKHGLVADGSMQLVDDITIFPSEYFDPAMQIACDKTYSIHRYSSLWSFPGINVQKRWEQQRQCWETLQREGKISYLN